MNCKLLTRLLRCRYFFALILNLCMSSWSSRSSSFHCRRMLSYYRLTATAMWYTKIHISLQRVRLTHLVYFLHYIFLLAHYNFFSNVLSYFSVMFGLGTAQTKMAIFHKRNINATNLSSARNPSSRLSWTTDTFF